MAHNEPMIQSTKIAMIHSDGNIGKAGLTVTIHVRQIAQNHTFSICEIFSCTMWDSDSFVSQGFVAQCSCGGA